MHYGIGEICPLPGFHADTLPVHVDIRVLQRVLCELIVGEKRDLPGVLQYFYESTCAKTTEAAEQVTDVGEQCNHWWPASETPAALCGLEMALAHAFSRLEGRHIADVLGLDGALAADASRAHVQLTAGLVTRGEATSAVTAGTGGAITSAKQKTSATLKFKVGIPGMLSAE